MNTADDRDDPVFATLAALRSCDVRRSRAERLRRHCHAVLKEFRTQPFDSGVVLEGALWRRMVGPAIAGAWCAIYVIETIRRAVAFYGF